ncbi:hypothetical protein YC2023_081549 [Brassica napus]
MDSLGYIKQNTTILSENATIRSENATILAELASQKKFNTEIMQKLDRLIGRRNIPTDIYPSEFTDEPLQPESTSNAQAVEDLENVQLVENLTVFGHDAVVHSEPEAEVGEFDEDSEDSD